MMSMIDFWSKVVRASIGSIILMFDAHEPADALGKPNASGGRFSISSSTGLPLLRYLSISFSNPHGA